MSHTEQMREALEKLVAALQKELADDWTCASYHPDLRPALKLALAALTAPAAEVPEAMGDELAWLDGEDFNTALIRYRGAAHFQEQDGTVDRLQAVKDMIRAQWQSTRLRGGVPEGWRIDREGNDVIVVQHQAIGLARATNPATSMVGQVLFALADDILQDRQSLTAAPQAPAPAVDAGVVPERAALAELFKDAMDWGRSYGRRLNLSDITVSDVSGAYADKAIKTIFTAAPPVKEDAGVVRELPGAAREEWQKVARIAAQVSASSMVPVKAHALLAVDECFRAAMSAAQAGKRGAA